MSNIALNQRQFSYSHQTPKFDTDISKSFRSSSERFSLTAINNYPNFKRELSTTRAIAPAKLKKQSHETTITDLLRTIKRLSGLTWDVIADVIGTSTRSLHLWRKGGKIAQVRFLRVQDLEETLKYIDPGSGLKMKKMFSKIEPQTGKSVLRLLEEGNFQDVRNLLGKGRGRRDIGELTDEERALFTPLPVSVLISQRHFRFSTSYN